MLFILFISQKTQKIINPKHLEEEDQCQRKEMARTKRIEMVRTQRIEMVLPQRIKMVLLQRIVLKKAFLKEGNLQVEKNRIRVQEYNREQTLIFNL